MGADRQGPTLVHINRERDRRNRAERQSVKASLIAGVRHYVPEEIDGFAVIAFKHGANGIVYTWTDYHVRFAVDSFSLPAMAEHKIRKRIAESTETTAPGEFDEPA